MVLQAQKLVKHYGEHVALVGLDLEVAAGEVFCLLGANGAGKTTTIQLFLGFIEPTSGSASPSRSTTCSSSPEPFWTRLQ